MQVIAAASAGPSLTAERLLDLRRPSEAVVSASGGRVAISVLDPVGPGPAGAPSGGIWVADVGRPAVPLIATGGLDTQPRWSPDGRELAFASDSGHPGRMSLHVLAEGHDRPLPLGHVRGSVEQIAWSRDWRIAAGVGGGSGLDTASAHNATTIRGEPDGGGDPDPLVFRPVSAWRRLFLIERATGVTSQVEFDGLTVWEFDWDGGATLAAVVSNDSSESGWYTAHLLVVGLDAEARQLERIDSDWQLALPRLSPDGARIAFLEGVCSDRGILAGVPMAATIGSGQARPIVGGSISTRPGCSGGISGHCGARGGAESARRSAWWSSTVGTPMCGRARQRSAAGCRRGYPWMPTAPVRWRCSSGPIVPPEAVRAGPRRGRAELDAADDVQRRTGRSRVAGVVASAVDVDRRS